MRPVPTLIAAVALGAASSLAIAAPAPAQETPDAASCLLPSLLATPVPAATPAATKMEAKLAAWYAAPLTDVCTGEAFTLAQFAPKAVFVHPMATT